MEEPINVTPEAVQDAQPAQPQVDQMEALRKSAIEAISQADGFVLFSFRDGDVQLQDGSKIKVPKNMLGSVGAIGGGSVSLPFVVNKAKALLDSENEVRNRQQAAISE